MFQPMMIQEKWSDRERDHMEGITHRRYSLRNHARINNKNTAEESPSSLDLTRFLNLSHQPVTTS